MKLFISPHNDDETLFGAFTLMREKPLVVIVTDSYVQQNRGENITPYLRFQETVDAMKVLGCSVMRLGLRDDIVDELAIIERLAWFKNFETVYAPALQGGNPVHDLVAKAAVKVFGDKIKQYSTYMKGEWRTKGHEVVPASNPESEVFVRAEADLREKALDCYQSQIKLPATRGHFDAARGALEWYI